MVTASGTYELKVVKYHLYRTFSISTKRHWRVTPPST